MFKGRNPLTYPPPIKITVYLFITVIFFLSFLWGSYTSVRNHQAIYKTIAQTSLEKDKMYREWAASHGGVYVQIDKHTPPNPYLKIPNRDVNVSGMQLTLMNPAYMTRQVMELYSASYGIKEHLTSLKPLNPKNTPDVWERKALESFEQGKAEASEFYTENGEDVLRYMIPFPTKQECLKCHADQGYKIGDIRGGLSILFPLAAYKFHNASEIIGLAVTHIILLLLTLLSARFLMNKIDEEYAQRIEQQNLMLLQAKNAQMGEMLSMIAHQWRQPLNAISAASIIINMRNELKQLDPEMINEQMRFIQEQTQHMSRIINEFMNFFRPENKKVLIEPEKIMEALNNLISAQLASHGVKLVCDVSSSFNFYSYPRELEHIFLNLIINARDAYENVNTEEKSISIGCAHSQGHIEITVSDNAGGIPAEIMERIFDPYFTTKEQGKGSGIGLYMVKRIVQEIFSGTISVVNRDGGACFIITFPIEESSFES